MKKKSDSGRDFFFILILKMNLSQTLSTFDSLQLSWGFFSQQEMKSLSQILNFQISLAGNEISLADFENEISLAGNEISLADFENEISLADFEFSNLSQHDFFESR